MRISHSYKFIWVSKPKTGSTSYRNLLDPYCEVKSTDGRGEFYHHSKLLQIKKIFGYKGWDFESYIKICPVRNPWELLVSLYSYSKTDVNGVKWWESKDKAYLEDKKMSFTTWINKEEVLDYLEKMHKLESYIFDENGNDMSDFVFSPKTEEYKFKNFIKDRRGLDLDSINIPNVNKTSKSKELLIEVSECFRDKLVGRNVEKIFNYEINRFEFKNPFLG